MGNLSKKARKNIIALIIIIIGTVLSFIFFGPGKNSGENEISSENVAKNVKVLEINQDSQSQAKLEKTVNLSSQNSAEAVAEYSGRITRVNFSVGDYVQAGQILAYFDQSGLANTARISWESLQKTYDLTKKSLEETKNSAYESIKIAKKDRQRAEIELDQAEDGGDQDEIDLAEKDLDIAEDQEDQAEFNAQNSIKASQIQLEAVSLQLEQARASYEKTFIKAPISGQVVSKNISLNDYLISGSSIAQIIQKGEIETKIYLNNSEVSKVKKGDKVKIEKDGQIFEAEISNVASIANSTNQRFEVLIKGGKDLEALINQSVKITLTLKLENGNRFFIPLEAVNIGQTKREVFVVENGVAKSREVVTGDIVGNSIEIVSGLSEGDLLIIEGNKKVRDEEEVLIKN